MNANYHMRQVALNDAAKLQEACWPNWSIEAIRDLLQRVDGISRRSRGLGIVAYNEDNILGYGQLTVWPRTTEISDLIVTPDCRSHGIGTAIILCLIDKARAWHLPQVEIGVALNNPRAMALYQRLGFQEDRVINLDLGHGVEAVMYLTMPVTPKIVPSE